MYGVRRANRLLAIALIGVWLLPAYRLLHLPHERAVGLARVVREQLASGDRDPIPAQRLRPYYSSNDPLPRAEASRIAADPELLEFGAWFAWIIEAAFLAVGTCGIVCLWWKPRYWRLGVIAGVMAFAVTLRLYSFVRQFWIRFDVWTDSKSAAAFYTAHFATGSARTLAFLSGATLVLASVTLYTVLQRDRLQQEPAQKGQG